MFYFGLSVFTRVSLVICFYTTESVNYPLVEADSKSCMKTIFSAHTTQAGVKGVYTLLLFSLPAGRAWVGPCDPF